MSSERNGTPAEGPVDEAAHRRVHDFLVGLLGSESVRERFEQRVRGSGRG